jgi:hypothetical protein
MATPPYATTTDLETRLGRDLTEEEMQRSGALLDTVSAYVDLNLSTCVDTILLDHPSILVDVVCSATLRALATPLDRDPTQSSVQLGEAQVSYRYRDPKGSTGGYLNDDELATLRKACGQGVAQGLGSVPVTTVMHDLTNRSVVGTFIVNGPQPDDVID